MKRDTPAWNRHSVGWLNSSASAATLYYIVQSTGTVGERSHHLRSDLYETRPQAETELAQLRHADSGGSYSVWKSMAYVEPAEWLHRVVRADGTLILPRLHSLEKLTDV
jgi:hypothetical protein